MTICQDNAPKLAGSVLFLATLAYSTYGLRVYTRITARTWGPEDWSMTVAAVTFIMLVVSCAGGAFNGIGVHLDTLSQPENMQYQILGEKYFFIFDIAYCAAIVPIKLSLSLMLIRLAGHQMKKFIYAQYVVIAIYVAMNIAITVFGFINCTPIAANWDKSLLQQGAYCYPASYLADFYYATTAVNIVTDWATALMPVILLWRVKMNRKTKIGTAALLGLGIFASVTGCIRLKYTVELTDEEDFLYNVAIILIWGFAENALGMTAGNIATLRPLFQRFLKNDNSEQASSGPDTGLSRRRHFFPSYELGDQTLANGMDTTIQGGPSKRRGSQASDADSRKEILGQAQEALKEPVITVSQKFDIEYE